MASSSSFPSSSTHFLLPSRTLLLLVLLSCTAVFASASDASPDAMRAASDVASQLAADILQSAHGSTKWLTALRRQIHENPQLMYQEEETSRLVQNTLKAYGVQFTAGVAGTGVVANIGSGKGPIVALRADMDALPITEEADVGFPSKVPGKMHACGHDAHTAMLLGAARVLQQRHQTEPLPGTVRLLFQPAEEGGAGGAKMVEEGALEGVSLVLALHVNPNLDVGILGSKAGPLMAGTAMFNITVRGKGGHAAFPHAAHDPVLAAAHIVTGLQSLVSRETDPLGSAVLGISTFHAGTAANIIPDVATLSGTARVLTKDGLARITARLEQLASSLAAGFNCNATVEFRRPLYLPTVNHEGAYRHGRQAVLDLFGEKAYVEVPTAMTGEDFSFMQEAAPGALFWIGVRNEEEGITSGLHTSKFKLDERMLPLGTAFLAHAAESFLRFNASSTGGAGFGTV